MIKKYGIGLDIGGTGIKAAVVDSEGSMYRKKSYPTEYENPAWFAEKLISIGEALLEESEKAGQRIDVISVTFPGIVEDGVVTGGAENFPGIEPFPLQKMFADRFDLPVITMNDAAGMALGEFYFGAARGVRDALFLTVGTGIGGCVMIDGRIYNGTGDRGGELGHIVIERKGKRCDCGGRGCFQLYGSASALIDYYRRIGGEGHPEADGHWIVERYREEDRKAVEAMEWHFQNLAAGLGSLANIFCPPLIVLGGGMVNAGPFYLEKIGERMAEYTMDHIGPEVRLAAAELGSYAGCAGGIGWWFL